ncbi:MAG: potassium transporter Kup [Pseudomonadota bacterium]|jgi:KUP system potassium uptake protein
MKSSHPSVPPSDPCTSPPPSVASAHGQSASGAALALPVAALGVVYGDIGTSPLYALKECVTGAHGVAPTPENVLGILSLMFWSVILVVSVKYLTLVMRADNQGEGGILALLALLPEKAERRKTGRIGALTALALFGACLLYGDGIITPAISVLSATEGLQVATSAFKPVVVPLTIAIILGLFAIQKRGTAVIGKLFGPVMVVWFVTIGALGAFHLSKHPEVLAAINPAYAVSFFQQHGSHAFLVLGSVVLVITGGEALYADMGHFGRRPIQQAWYVLVLPALLLNYFGQGALLTTAPDAETLAQVASNPFYALVPKGPLVYPLVAISTLATVIASQALISGAYSLTRQAVQLGYLPRVTIKHTSSSTEGQIYIPEVNAALAFGCVGLVLAFQESSALAAAYGVAVTGTMGITTVAFYVVTRRRWNWPVAKALPIALFFLTIDIVYFASNTLKFFDGGFVPIVIGIGLFTSMVVWKRGRELLGQHFAKLVRPLAQFIDALKAGHFKTDTGEELPLVRVPGVAVFLTSSPDGTPPLLLHHARFNKALHNVVLLLTVINERVPRVLDEYLTVDALEQGFYRVQIRVGFMETPNVPRALADAVLRFELPFVLDDVTYYLGRETLLATGAGKMSMRAEQLFAFMSRNAQNAPRYFGIPPERVVEIGMQIDL